MIIREPERRMEIRKLEELAAGDPVRFKSEHRAVVFRALRWLVLCQASPVIMAALGAAGLWWIEGYVVMDLVLLVGGLGIAWIVSCCLVVRFPEVGALKLDRRTHALLFRDINEIRQKIDAPKFTRIEFTMELNAAITQRARWFGLLGTSSTLYIGFPLIFCLSRNEFKTVLAHEIAHVSRRHGVSARWILQVHASIVNIHERFGGGRRGMAGRVLGWWLDKFMPSLVAHGLVAGRLHEREADRIAAAVCGVDACARALVKIATLGALYVEDFQQSLEDRMRTSDFPNISILEEFQRHVDGAIRTPSRARELLRRALLRASDLTSSHPSLSERLKNVGVDWSGDVDLSGGAAEEYFGRGYKQLREELDRSWVLAILPSWRERHDGFRAIEARLHKCSNMQDAGEKLHGFELMNVAAWTEELYGPGQGLSAYAEYHERYPQVYEGRFHYGRLLLANDDARGVPILEALAGSDPAYREAGILLLQDYHHRRGNLDRAGWCEEQLEAFYRDMKTVLEDRFKQRKKDAFHLHGMPVDFQESLYRLCGEFPEIQRLHLLRKEVRFFTESPFFVMVVTFNFRAGLRTQRERLMNILRNVVELPGDCVVVDGQRHKSLRRLLSTPEFAAAKIYDHNDG